MALFDSIEHTANVAIQKGEVYLKSSERYYKLKVFQMVTSSISLVIKAAIIGLFLLIAFIFIAIALSIVIGNALNSDILGYLVVALIYIVLAIITYFFRTGIENKIIKTLSDNFFDDEDRI